MADSPGHGPQTYRVTIPESAAGQRLDRTLAALLPGFSRSRLQALIVAGALRSGNEAATDPAEKVRPGDTYDLDIPPPEPATPEPQGLPLDIVFEDAHLLVVNKPAGMVVHPAAGNPDGTLVNALLAHCGPSLQGIGGVARPGIVHRIDKDTSGLLVAAKTEAAHSGLAEQFAAHSTDRAYTALVRGCPRPAGGTVTGNIGRNLTNRKKMAVVSRGGKHAVTHYTVIERFGPPDRPLAALIDCRLETGRTHQIRVHMASIGYPLLGDPLYARAMKESAHAGLKAAVAGFGRQALHARRLGFAHPVTGAALCFEAKLPEDFVALLSFMREYS